MYIIGITGGSGAGKTSAARALQTLGAVTLDCDEIYHELLLSNAEMSAKIKTRFEGVTKGGSIDRQKLGKVVWGDPSALLELNMITHKYISDEIEQSIESFRARGEKIIAIDAIALIESGQSGKCDVVVGVTAPAETRTNRIMKRDGLTNTQAQIRIDAQKPDSFYLENCDHILENIYNTPSEFEKKCRKFFEELLNIRESKTHG